MEKHWDVIVIGGGPAGYTAAIRAKQHGLNVLLGEKEELGGTCLNRGCIPSKALIHCAKVWQTVKNAQRFGVFVSEHQFNWEEMQKWTQQVVQTLRRGLQLLLRHHGVTVIKGEAKLVEPDKVKFETEKGESTVSAKALILAMGSSSVKIPCEPEAPVITEEQALFLPSLPDSVVVVGGGASGVELAWLFNALGVKVTLVEMLPQILPTVDVEIAEGLKRSLERQGIDVRTETKAEKISAQKGKGIVQTKKGQIEADLVICALGRKPNSEGLSEIGIQISPNGSVIVNEWQQTSLPSVFAIGDLVHGSGTAHGGMFEGERAVKAIVEKLSSKTLQRGDTKPVVPICVYSEPQVLSVGITEQEAEKIGLEIEVVRFPWRALGAAIAVGEVDGFVKVIAEAKTKRVIGIHILGHDVSNLNGEVSLTVMMEMTPQEAVKAIRQHPSLNEGIKEALWAMAGLPLHIAKRPERGRW
ncbi:MAG: dihydrolipoyl dehydrogenase [Armatimonadetes bacterium]|nr:dihydrolipoyl dehydrogenase [Armatimonadota bacterium]MDW8028017.1 dihydrolipoyl dehydrogenase [Armatimonadota bacterium]